MEQTEVFKKFLKQKGLNRGLPKLCRSKEKQIATTCGTIMLMPRRLQAVLEKGGNATKYWPDGLYVSPVFFKSKIE